MGQKVQPVGIRLGITSEWTSRWFATGRDYAKYLKEDAQVRNFIRNKLANSAISNITIERPAQNMKVVIHTARPGTVIGKKGEDIGTLRRELTEIN